MKKIDINMSEAYGYPTYLIFNVHVFKKQNENGLFEDNVDMLFIAKTEEEALMKAKQTIKRSKSYRYRSFQVIQKFLKKDIKEKI